jgi:hypothetical protein
MRRTVVSVYPFPGLGLGTSPYFPSRSCGNSHPSSLSLVTPPFLFRFTRLDLTLVARSFLSSYPPALLVRKLTRSLFVFPYVLLDFARTTQSRNCITFVATRRHYAITAAFLFSFQRKTKSLHIPPSASSPTSHYHYILRGPIWPLFV